MFTQAFSQTNSIQKSTPMTNKKDHSYPFMNFPLLSRIKDIAERPVLIVVGDHAFSRYFGETAYKEAAEPKELYVVPDAGHVDLYDRMDKIPFDKLEAFFKNNLK